MRLLLDTHVLLWFLAGDPLLSAYARRLIEDTNNEKWVSLASAWEMAIKISIGKLTLTQPLPTLIPHQLQSNGFDVLDIGFNHIVRVSTLPLHHRDPFDRLLIAQALEGQMPIVGAAPAFDAYGVRWLW